MRRLFPTILFLSGSSIAPGCTVGPKSTGDDSGGPASTSGATDDTGVLPTTDPSPTGAATSTTTSSTTDTPPITTSTTTPGTSITGSSVGTDDSADPPETGGLDLSAGPCDLGAQDCADGFKCNPADFNGQSIFSGNPECVPVVPDAVPPGAPCSTLGNNFDGTDDCQLGSACLFPDENGNGECLTFCGLGDLTCAADQHCFGLTCQTCLFGFCDEPCDPRDLDVCGAQVCSSSGDSWFCAPDNSGVEGQDGDPCEFLNACDPGHTCINADQVPGCMEGGACCSPMCSTDAPNTCPNAEQGETCVPWYPEGEAPPQFVTLGVCGVAL